eukprot:244549_1
MLLLFVTLFIITKVVKSGTGAYYGYVYCQQSGNYNLSWYPLLDITLNTSDINSQYQYLYSPCNLSFYSTELDEHFAMKRYDLSTGEEQYLIPTAAFQYVEPVRDPNQPILTWKFEYSYPNNSCPNSVQIIQIYWQCNATIDNYPYYNQIISAGPLFDCFDSIFIQSPCACDDSLVYPEYQPNCTFLSNGKTLNLYDYPVGYVSGYDNHYIWAACHNVKLAGYYFSQNNYGTLYPNDKQSADVYATWHLSTGVNMYHYDPTINVWNFTLIGYNITRQINFNNPYHCDVFETYIIFGCNCYTSYKQYIELIEPNNECYMTINVTKNDLCIDYINQCFPYKNNTNCVYYYRHNDQEPYDKLNLSALTNQQIGDVEQGGLYAFIYTPCNNNFFCNNVSSMAGRKTINSNQCIESLALFNGTSSFNVTHEMGTSNWIIEYLNGGKCPNNPDAQLRFRTTWKHAYTKWVVNSVNFEEEDCLYDVSISSQYVGY